MSDAQAQIKKMVDDNKILLFMKGIPDAPMCGFSMRAVNALYALGAEFQAVNVLDHPEIREGIKVFSNWPTIPQLYVGGEFVGGSDIVLQMFESGDLKNMIDATDS